LGRRELSPAFPAEFESVRIVGMTGRALDGHVEFPLYASLKITGIRGEVNRSGRAQLSI
jgi:hypothetical protein